MNSILSFLAGILFAYLFVWTIRNIAGRLFLVCLLSPACFANSAQVWLYAGDTASGTYHVVEMSSNGGASWSATTAVNQCGTAAVADCGSGGTSLSGSDYFWVGFGAGYGNPAKWRVVNYPGGTISGPYDFEIPPNDSANHFKYFNSTGETTSTGESFTNHVGTVYFINTNQFGSDFRVVIKTNGVVMRDYHDWIGTAGVVAGTFTNDVAWTWEVFGPGNADNDYVPKLVGSGSSTAVAGVESGPPPSGLFPETANPGVGGTAAVSTNQQTINALQAQLSLGVGQLLSQLEKNRTNFTNSVMEQFMTNQPNYSNVLERIHTNTLESTNLLYKMSTNSDIAASALSGGGASTYSNIVTNVSGFLNSAMSDFGGSSVGSNSAGWQGQVLGSETNQVPEGSSDSALTYTFENPVSGTQFRLNLDIFSFFDDTASTVGMKGKIVDWLQWLNAWILKLIPFVAFWAFASLMFSWVNEINHASLLVAGSPDVAPWKLAGKVFIAALVVSLALIVGALPTLLVAKMQAGAFSMSPIIPSVVDHIEEGTGMDFIGAATRFWLFLNEGIPFTTVIFTIAHYLAFTLYGRTLMTQAYWGLRAFKFLASAIVLCFVGIQSEAASLRVLNLDTNSIVFTNEDRQLAFPPGETVLNIEDAAWKVGDLAIDLDAAEFEVVYRFARDELGVLVADRALDDGDWSWFWMGFKLGSIMFGWAMVVNWLRQGMNAPAKYGGPAD